MMLVAKEKTWGPRWPQFNPQTHQITGWTHGWWKPGVPPVEWPGAPQDAPDTLAATNEKDQAILDDARAIKRASAELSRKERLKARLKNEALYELREEQRNEVKALLKAEMATEAPTTEPAAPAVVTAKPAPKKRGRPPKAKPAPATEPVSAGG